MKHQFAFSLKKKDGAATMLDLALGGDHGLLGNDTMLIATPPLHTTWLEEYKSRFSLQ